MSSEKEVDRKMNQKLRLALVGGSLAALLGGWHFGRQWLNPGVAGSDGQSRQRPDHDHAGHGDGAPNRPVAKSSDAGVLVEPEDREATGGVRVADVPDGVVGSIESFRKQMSELRSNSSASHFEYKRLLMDIARLGSAEAVDYLCHLMGDEGLNFSHRARAFADAAMELESPKLASAAMQALDRRWAKGEVSVYDVGGYIDIMARLGGESESLRLLEAIASGPPVLAGAVAQKVSLLNGKVPINALFEAAMSRGEFSESIFQGLASWEDDRVLQKMGEVARQSGASVRVRSAALSALLGADQRSGMEAATVAYWEATAEVDRLVVLQGLSGACRGGDVSGDMESAKVESIVLHAVASSELDLVGGAVGLVKADGRFLTPRVKEALRQAVGSPSLSSEVSSEIERLIGTH